MPINRVWPAGVYRRLIGDDPTPRYAQVTEFTRGDGSRTIHVAGTFGCDLDQKFAGDRDMREQVITALENIRLSLESVGATVADVVRMKLYAVDIDAFVREGSAEYQKWFDGNLPASTAIGVSGLALAGAVVEIEAYAELD